MLKPGVVPVASLAVVTNLAIPNGVSLKIQSVPYHRRFTLVRVALTIE